MKRTLFLLLVLLSSLVAANAQVPKMDPASWGILNYKTNLGSFKILRDRSRPAEGKLDLSFSGTLLIRGLKGTATVTSGQIRKEIDRQAENITVYFGTGKISVYGQFDAIQWFGKNLNGKFNGFGIVRLYGEFDKDLNTGVYWTTDAKNVKYWSPHGTTVGVPSSNDTTAGVKPVERGSVGPKPRIQRP